MNTKGQGHTEIFCLIRGGKMVVNSVPWQDGGIMRLLIGSLFCHSVSLLTSDNADMCEPEPITNPRPGSAIRPR